TRDVKPILVKHCVTCHGPTKPKAELRLNLYARIKQGGNSGPAITPGKSAESLMIHAVTGSKPDVTKMPPKGGPLSAEQVAILKDTAPGAYERLVDRLLDSPHYGEHQARLWLDMARYADSNGFTIDAPRSIWKYRDYVINAFNRDLPFDQFTIEQLAGDLLPKPTTDQLIATGFHRNTMVNQEGGID